MDGVAYLHYLDLVYKTLRRTRVKNVCTLSLPVDILLLFIINVNIAKISHV